MRTHVIAAVAVVSIVAGSPDAFGQAPIERLFYYVDTPESYASLRERISQIRILAPSSYFADEDGVIWGDVDRRVLELAAEHDVAVMPLVLNPGFDQEVLHRLLEDDAARARAVRTMVELCRRKGYAGIQFDFENLHLRDRDAFTHFYREAAAALHRAGFKISIAVVHRPDDFAGPSRYHKWLFKNWRAGYDLKAIGAIGDFISVMTYSQHTRRTPPGPQAGLPWVREVVEYFLEFVPPEKLSLGIPLSSQHWYTSQEDQITPELARSYSESLSYGEAIGLVERHRAPLLWSEEHAVPYAFYANAGVFEWIFLEDARSFRAKLDLVREYRLRGFSAWVLGREDPGIWLELGGRARGR